MELIMEAPESSDFVVSTGVARSVQDLVQLAFSAIGVSDWEAHTLIDPDFKRPNDPPKSIGDSRKIRKELGWHPTVSLENIMMNMVNADLAQIESGQDESSPDKLRALKTPKF
jgi:GDPmannose 4,6-dehydratase